MIYLISYDLDHHARPAAYQAVEKMLKEESISWAKPLYSQWFVQSNDSLDTWQARMQKAANSSDDYWLIVQIVHPYQGWLKQPVWDWLNARI